jgi:5-methyltetrahydrofolate--homocysteine methyltransferase
VKSTVVMRENLEEMTREGLDVPVLLGGAALTRKYVEEDCVAAYGAGRVAYASDAFDGLDLMDKVVTHQIDGHLKTIQTKRAGRPSNTTRKLGEAAEARPMRPVDVEELKLRRAELAAKAPIPAPPFWGPRTLDHVPVKTLIPYLNERMLYQFQWGFRKAGKSLDEYKAWAALELKPILKRMLDMVEADAILKPQAVYGYWRCYAEGDSVVLVDEGGTKEVARFAFPRQGREGGLCIADFFRDRTANELDVIGLQVVTVGQRASDVAREWFAENRYQDYLYLHGLGVELAEALAEYVHKRIRAELGFAGEDDRDIDKMLQQGYRGSRYSFGYPACPNLADQEQILKLLDAPKIGISLSDEWQLHPEQSTSAIVLHHPQAKYFSV